MKIFLARRSHMHTLCTLCYILIYSLFSPCTLNAQTVSPLEKRLSIQFEDVKISEAIQQIGQRIDHTFVYSNQLLDTERRISKKYNNETVVNLLSLLTGRKLKFKIIGKQIHIALDKSEKKRISGRINAQGNPLEAVSVRIGGNITFTDVNGRFYLDVITSEQAQEIQVSSIGYKPVAKKIVINEDWSSKIDIELIADEHQLEQVKVIGKTETQKLKESGFNVNAVELAKFNNTTKDLNQVLNTTTGIRIREYGGLGSEFNFSLNGLSGKAVRFFVDGIPMENYGVGMTFNNIPVNLAERVEVYKGVVPIELGSDALGGAINMVTNKGTKSYLDASYSYGSFNTQRASLNAQYANERTGLLAKLTSFYNFSDNNYWMHSNSRYDAPILVPDGNGNFAEKSVKRFHDQYRSTMVQGEIGFVNRRWADVIMVAMLYNDHYKEYQTGARQTVVYGKVNRNGDYIMPSIRYKKNNLLIKGLSTNAFLSYGVDRYAVVDTSSTTYWWDGSARSINNNYGEIGASIPRAYTNFENKFLLARVHLSYELDTKNAISFTQNYSSADQTSNEELSGKIFTPSGQAKSIYGLAWQNNAINNRLKTEVFAKLFHFNLNIGEVVGGRSQRAAQHRDYNNYGYGMATRYSLNKNSQLRLSYEHAIRLPELLEVLGDGVNFIPNPDIRPESSHNLNLGFSYSKRIDKQTYNLNVGSFLRHAKDFIYSIPAGNNSSQYLNEGKVIVYGGEAEVQYKYGNLLDVAINGSFQRSQQNQEFIYGTSTPRETYGNLIPNQPWLFANLYFSIGKSDWLGKGTRLQFDWSSQYLHQFYLTWEAWGSAQSLNVIPSQLLHNAGLTYSLKQGRYNISLESRNLGNELAYDNFRLQKPGRSFNLKLRYYYH